MEQMEQTPSHARSRVVIWKPWRGHNENVLAERAAARNVWFGFSPRDPAGYQPALPRLPVFYSEPERIAA